MDENKNEWINEWMNEFEQLLFADWMGERYFHRKCKQIDFRIWTVVTHILYITIWFTIITVKRLVTGYLLLFAADFKTKYPKWIQIFSINWLNYNFILKTINSHRELHSSSLTIQNFIDQIWINHL